MNAIKMVPPKAGTKDPFLHTQPSPLKSYCADKCSGPLGCTSPHPVVTPPPPRILAPAPVGHPPVGGPAAPSGGPCWDRRCGPRPQRRHQSTRSQRKTEPLLHRLPRSRPPASTVSRYQNATTRRLTAGYFSALAGRKSQWSGWRRATPTSDFTEQEPRTGIVTAPDHRVRAHNVRQPFGQRPRIWAVATTAKIARQRRSFDDAPVARYGHRDDDDGVSSISGEKFEEEVLAHGRDGCCYCGTLAECCVRWRDHWKRQAHPWPCQCELDLRLFGVERRSGRTSGRQRPERPRRSVAVIWAGCQARPAGPPRFQPRRRLQRRQQLRPPEIGRSLRPSEGRGWGQPRP